jgi:hypothetical protein
MMVVLVAAVLVAAQLLTAALVTPRLHRQVKVIMVVKAGQGMLMSHSPAAVEVALERLDNKVKFLTVEPVERERLLVLAVLV